MPTMIITGAAGGIGRALLSRVATPDQTLVLNDVNADGLDEVAAAARAAGATVTTVVSALDTPQDCQTVIDACDGAVSSLVHLAGIFQPDPDGPNDMNVWETAINSNLKNAYMIAGLVAPVMARTATAEATARMVFIASLAFNRGSWDHIPYSCAKGGLVGLVRAMSRKHAPSILINGLAPGVIATPMPAHLLELRGEDKIVREVPLGRLGRADEVAGVITFLLGPDSTFITGQVINVDGGVING